VNIFEQKNTELIKEFNRYVRAHPKVAERIPDDAIVILQLEGDEEFNVWARQLAENRRSEGYPMVLSPLPLAHRQRTETAPSAVKTQIAPPTLPALGIAVRLSSRRSL
jgi:hypothetical protein